MVDKLLSLRPASGLLGRPFPARRPRRLLAAGQKRQPLLGDEPSLTARLPRPRMRATCALWPVPSPFLNWAARRRAAAGLAIGSTRSALIPGASSSSPGGGPFADLVRATQARDRLRRRGRPRDGDVGDEPVRPRAGEPAAGLRHRRIARRDARGSGARHHADLVAGAHGAGGGAAGELGSYLRQSRRLARRALRRADGSSSSNTAPAAPATALARRGVVDPLFPAYLAAAKVRAFLAAPDGAGAARRRARRRRLSPRYGLEAMSSPRRRAGPGRSPAPVITSRRPSR